MEISKRAKVGGAGFLSIRDCIHVAGLQVLEAIGSQVGAASVMVQVPTDVARGDHEEYRRVWVISDVLKLLKPDGRAAVR